MIELNYFQLFQLFLLTFTSICATLAIGLSIKAMIKLEAMEKSTHNIEYIPADPDWASSDKEIQELNERAQLDTPIIDEDEAEEPETDLKTLI